MGLNSMFQRGRRAIGRDEVQAPPMIHVGDFVQVPLDTARGLAFFGRAEKRLYNPDRMVIFNADLRARMTVTTGQAILVCTEQEALDHLNARLTRDAG